jgi:hypothetical protein
MLQMVKPEKLNEQKCSNSNAIAFGEHFRPPNAIAFERLSPNAIKRVLVKTPQAGVVTR